MKVGLAQMECLLGDVEANLSQALRYIQRAKEQGVDLLIFPELSLTGYDLGERVTEVAMTLESQPLATLRAESRALSLVVGFVEESTYHRPYNAAAYLEDGSVRHLHRKLYLPTYAVFQEGRHFTPGDSIEAFDTRYGRMAILICADTWIPPVAYIAVQDEALVLLHLATSSEQSLGECLDLPACWEGINRVFAQLHGVYVIFVNRVGREGTLRYWGGSEIIDPRGQVVAKAPYFEEGLFSGEIHLETARDQRAAAPLMRDPRLELLIGEMQRVQAKLRRGNG
jgi:predicted amidohydrolase